MNRPNYYKLMENQISTFTKDGEKKRLLLHCCCAPCSSACLELLNKHFHITAYFYNPNITDEAEFIKRFEELTRFVNTVYVAGEVELCLAPHEKEKFYEIAKGLEEFSEKGPRCYKCYELRMNKAASFAKENGFDVFTTTLSISRHKNAVWINDIGVELSKAYDIPFLYSDFKKRGGEDRSLELSAQYGLYRQEFCGCEFSRKK